MLAIKNRIALFFNLNPHRPLAAGPGEGPTYPPSRPPARANPPPKGKTAALAVLDKSKAAAMTDATMAAVMNAPLVLNKGTTYTCYIVAATGHYKCNSWLPDAED